MTVRSPSGGGSGPRARTAKGGGPVGGRIPSADRPTRLDRRAWLSGGPVGGRIPSADRLTPPRALPFGPEPAPALPRGQATPPAAAPPARSHALDAQRTTGRTTTAHRTAHQQHQQHQPPQQRPTPPTPASPDPPAASPAA